MVVVVVLFFHGGINTLNGPNANCEAYSCHKHQGQTQACLAWVSMISNEIWRATETSRLQVRRLSKRRVRDNQGLIETALSTLTQIVYLMDSVRKTLSCVHSLFASQTLQPYPEICWLLRKPWLCKLKPLQS